MRSREDNVDICVLLATYRRPQLLAQTLRSLASQRLDTCSVSVTVADNASDPATREVAIGQAPELAVRYLAADRRRGKSAALNVALEALPECDLLVLTDDDIVAHPDWIAELWSAAQRWPDADVFGGRIKARFSQSALSPEVSEAWLRVAFGVENESGPERPVASDRLWGTNLAVRGRALAGGIRFDEALGPAQGDYATGCETDLTARLVEAGATCVFVPTAIVEHIVRDEQLAPAWLCQRAFKHGRGTAAKAPAASQHPLWGVPRWIYRRRAEWALRRWFRSFRGEQTKLLEANMEAEFLRGLASYYKEQAVGRLQSATRAG
jgi:GT2 family glycosyltransferase